MQHFYKGPNKSEIYLWEELGSLESEAFLIAITVKAQISQLCFEKKENSSSPEGMPHILTWKKEEKCVPSLEMNPTGCVHSVAFMELQEVHSVQFSSVWSLSRVWLFVTPWIAALQAPLSITNSWSLLNLMSIASVMSSSHLILCHPLLLLPPIPPSIRVFSNESTLRMRWPKYWSFSFNISPSNEQSGLISFRMDWLDLLAVQGTLKSLLRHHRCILIKYHITKYHYYLIMPFNFNTIINIPLLIIKYYHD